MASATPDLRLPSRPQSITALGPVPNCTAWRQSRIGSSNLPRAVAWQCTGRESNPGTLDLKSDTLTITPPSHPGLTSTIPNTLLWRFNQPRLPPEKLVNQTIQSHSITRFVFLFYHVKVKVAPSFMIPALGLQPFIYIYRVLMTRRE